MDKICSLCSRLKSVSYEGENLIVCEDCEASDKDLWHGLREAKKEQCAKRRKSLVNSVKRFKLEDRAEYPNEATVVIDGKYYYYCQKKKARVKGSKKYYQMRGFSHFVDVFLKK